MRISILTHLGCILLTAGCAATSAPPRQAAVPVRAPDGPVAAFHILVLGPDTTQAVAIGDVLVESNPRYVLGRTDAAGIYRVLEDPPNVEPIQYEIRATAETVGRESGVFLLAMGRDQIPLDTVVIRLNWHSQFAPGMDTTAVGLGGVIRRGMPPVNNE